MDKLGQIIALGQLVYGQCEKMNYCKKQSKRLAERVKGLVEALRSLQGQGERNLPKNIVAALNRFEEALHEANRRIEKFKNKNNIYKFLTAGKDVILFQEVNERLSSVWQAFSMTLQIDQRRLLKWQEEDKRDIQEDELSRQRHKESEQKNLEAIMRQWEANMEEIRNSLKHLMKLYQEMPRKQIPQEEIKEIKTDLLKESPWIQLRESEFSTIYKGEYYKSTVIIKVFNKLKSRSIGVVRHIFKNEITTMKKFDSPNILRIFGICIDETASLPQFSVIMEYCERGTLQELLEKEKDLPLSTRVHLILEAAKGLYVYDIG